MSDQENAGGGTPAPIEPQKTVAYDNFQAVVQAKQGLETQVATLRSQLQTLTEKAATVDTLAAQVGEWKGKAEQASTRFATFTEFSGALGTTDTDIIDSFDSKYRAMPEADRPARADWVKALKAAPDGAPAILRPWLAPVAPATAAPVAKPSPRVPGTPATPPTAPSAVSAEEVRRIREEAVATGDWSRWKILRAQFGGK